MSLPRLSPQGPVSSDIRQEREKRGPAKNRGSGAKKVKAIECLTHSSQSTRISSIMKPFSSSLSFSDIPSSLSSLPLSAG